MLMTLESQYTGLSSSPRPLAEDAIPVRPLWAEAGQSLGEDFCSARLVSTCYRDYLFVWQCDVRVEILDISVIPPLVCAIVDANYMVPGEAEADMSGRLKATATALQIHHKLQDKFNYVTT